ncbi:MAG: OmpH family outer membrane protein [Burkholderiales bacterium]|nr:OmpH family outer membrane protein [Burkholderiales bacterium]MDE1927487.1 OmpH family outer membrane protein [Burkholderiales bacterium]MDE2160132.1 OmpH family outer membrane protein [Burkholderiales bacterium]MDE2503350.1 OmpH family outer membrane protein [Burkholderiales bacterium]
MKTLVLRFLSAALMAVAIVAPAHADELKIGYVSLDRLMRESNPAKAAAAKLEAEFSKRDRDINDAQAKLKAAADKLDKDAPTLSEAERARRQRELVDADRDLQRKRRDLQDDLNQRRNEEMASVIERANRVIQQIFESEHYDLIVQDAVKAGPRVDITDKVIRLINAQPAPGGK